MEMRKNEKFTVRIQDISEDGAGIGKVEGYIWFIKDTVIGDLVEAGVMKAADIGAVALSREAKVSGGEGLRRMQPSGDEL